MHLKVIALALVCFSSAACAQPAPQAPQPEFQIKVTAQELDIIGRGLGSQPFNDVVGLINKLRSQVAEQQRAAPEAKKE